MQVVYINYGQVIYISMWVLTCSWVFFGFKAHLYVLAVQKGTAELRRGALAGSLPVPPLWVAWSGRGSPSRHGTCSTGVSGGVGFDHPWVLPVPIPRAQGWLGGTGGSPAASVPRGGPLRLS